MAMATKCIEGDGKHKLQKKIYKRPYTCYGCEEKGVGLRHRCDQCSYEFHESCALADPSKLISCEFIDLKFKILEYPPPAESHTCYCDVCGNIVKGFVLSCTEKPIHLHPCCGKLSLEIKKCGEQGEMKFHLTKNVEGPCMVCNKIQPSGSKIKGWSYMSECKKRYHVHVSCVTQMALAKDNNNLYMHKSITNRTSLSLTKPKLDKHKNNGKKVDMATEVFTFAAETILSTVFGGPTILVASLVSRFFFK